MFLKLRRRWHTYWAKKHALELTLAEAELALADTELTASARGLVLSEPGARLEGTLKAAARHRMAKFACSVYQKNLRYHEEKLKLCQPS